MITPYTRCIQEAKYYLQRAESLIDGLTECPMRALWGPILSRIEENLKAARHFTKLAETIRDAKKKIDT